MSMRRTRILYLLFTLFVAFGVSRVAAQVVAVADLSVTRITYPHSALTGHTIQFRIVATNNGPDASELDVIVSSSDSLQVVMLTCDRGISPDTPACEYSNVAAGDSVTTIVTAVVVGPPDTIASLNIQLSTEGQTTDPVSSNDTATVTVNIR
jgi:hypothetical protein